MPSVRRLADFPDKRGFSKLQVCEAGSKGLLEPSTDHSDGVYTVK